MDCKGSASELYLVTCVLELSPSSKVPVGKMKTPLATPKLQPSRAQRRRLYGKSSTCRIYIVLRTPGHQRKCEASANSSLQLVAMRLQVSPSPSVPRTLALTKTTTHKHAQHTLPHLHPPFFERHRTQILRSTLVSPPHAQGKPRRHRTCAAGKPEAPGGASKPVEQVPDWGQHIRFSFTMLRGKPHPTGDTSMDAF